MFLMDRFFDGTFLTFGIEVISFAERDQEDRIDPMVMIKIFPYLTKIFHWIFSCFQVYIFPRMTKCTFHKFGTSGEIEKHDAMCILPLNIGNHEMLPSCLWQSAISVNEKIYIFIWFWFLLLGFLTFLVLLYRILIVFSPRIRVSYFPAPVLCAGVDIGSFCSYFCLWKQRPISPIVCWSCRSWVRSFSQAFRWFRIVW